MSQGAALAASALVGRPDPSEENPARSLGKTSIKRVFLSLPGSCARFFSSLLFLEAGGDPPSWRLAPGGGGEGGVSKGDPEASSASPSGLPAPESPGRTEAQGLREKSLNPR